MSFTRNFNHGGARPAEAGDISDRINAHIDAAFFESRGREAARDYVGASAIGNDCLRAVQLGYMKVPVDDGRITGRLLRIFATGHVFEAALGEWLKQAGFALDILDPATQRQFGFSMLDGEGQGHVDGILRGGPVAMAYPALWECKTLNDKSWQEIKKKGLHVAKPLYAGQIAINQAYLQLHEHPALFTALNKNTSELYHALIPFDAALAQAMSDRMLRIVEATAQQILLPRAYSTPDFYKCRFCDHANTCWNKLR
jgi:hypothetical protein